jgi:ribonuclease HII
VTASVAAASILAKVSRDRMMRDLHERYPQYGFDRHKGYSTDEHVRALDEHGPCPEHRRSFVNVARFEGHNPSSLVVQNPAEPALAGERRMDA